MKWITSSLMLLLCMIMVFSACTDVMVNKTQELDYQSLRAVTGLDMLDASGASMGKWKTPNQNPGDGILFPVPGNGNIAFLGSEEFRKIWITPATCVIDTTNTNIEIASLSISVDIEDIEEIALEEYDASGNTFNLDLSNLGQGFYKIFYLTESGGDVNWVNYYLDPNYNGAPDIDLLDMECN